MPPSKAEALWAGAIPALSALVQHPFGSPEFTSSSATICQALIGLNQLPPYKPADWDAILKKLKVPYHIFSACAKTTQADPATCASSPINPAAFTTFALLHQLMNVCLRSELGPLSSSRPRGRASAQLNRTLFLQLHDSSLQDKLPALLSAVAAELTRAAGMTDAERQQQQVPGWDASAGVQQRQRKVPAARILAEQLLEVMMWVGNLQFERDALRDKLGSGAASGFARDGTTLLATLPVSVAFLELVLAVARDVNRSLAHLGPADCPDPDELAILAKALGIAQVLCPDSLVDLLDSDAARSGTAPSLQQVLLSPALVPCLALVLSHTMYCQTAEEQRQRNTAAAARPGSGSGSSSNRPAPSSGGGKGSAARKVIAPAAGLAWQQANQTLPTLPASHQQLCAALGLDARMLLTLAAIDMSSLPAVKHAPGFEAAAMLFAVFDQLMDLWSGSSMDRFWQKKPAAQQQLELQLQLLLPGVLLDCATRVPTSSPGHAKCSVMAAQSSTCAVAAWSHLTQPTKPLYGSRSRQEPHQQLPGSWVAEVLPAAIKVARRVLPALQADADMATAAQGSSTSSAGSASAAAARTAADSALPFSSATCMKATVDRLLMFCASVCDAVVPPGSLGPPAAASGAVSIHEHFNMTPELEQSLYGVQAAFLESLFGGSDSSPSPAASQASSNVVPDSPDPQPTDAPALDSMSVVAGGAVHLLRVLEGFMRMAAAQKASASQPPEGMCRPDACLGELLEHATLPTNTSRFRNLERDYKPAARCLLQLACMAGAGSSMQRAVYSVLSTTVKLCFLQHSSQGHGVLQDAGRCPLIAGEAAAYLLQTSLSSESAAGSTAPAGSAAPASSAGVQPASSTAAVQLLPSLVIVGRMCLLYGRQFLPKIPLCVQMREIKTGLHSMGQVRYMQLMQLYAREAPRNGVIDAMWREAPGGGMESKFDLILQACLEWLQDDTVAAQLSAAGYAPEPILQQLQALGAALKAARSGDTQEAGPFEVLAQQLQETGKLLCSLAVPLHCNNPLCTNISRTLEVSLVSGHSTKCSGCRVARYCQRACQKAHWRQHKPMCQALQAAAAATAAAAQAGEP